MADIITKHRRASPATAAPDTKAPAETAVAGPVASEMLRSAGDAGLLPLVEMLFFAYRDFTGEADAALSAYGLGRAHHRVLHFVNRNPGIRVADLLELLKITKQSLGRVLRKLVADGWVEQAPGPDDRRERRLSLTAQGMALAAELAELQTRRIGVALAEIGAGGGAGTVQRHIHDFLFAMISQGERATVQAVVAGPTLPDGTPKRLK